MRSWDLGIAGAVLVASFAITWLVREVALRRQLLDRPNERSAHVRPTPRLGGIGIMAAFLPAATAIVLLSGGGARALVVVAATTVISALGLVDDLHPLPARWRFGVQLAAASVVVGVNLETVRAAWTLVPLPVWLLVPMSVLWIVWVTNLYNFMDGIDGFAGGQAVIAGAAITAVAAGNGAGMQAGLALALVAAALGFLLLNFPPASIFMGDVGSTAIGFFLASMPFLPGSAALPVEVIGLAIGLFVLDATTTLVRRLSRGERFFEAHRTHLYQRPLALGVPHATITLAAYPGMAAVAAFALAYGAAGRGGRAMLIVAAVGVFLGYVGVVTSLERRSAAAGEPSNHP
ncbi:MraY family glycosyltransferase [Anaeromyxobacter oryzisoli]|uniref:MraY family glycosyltransferase n=1 Tax=Anaeromyxobacter oryzisoli TaxID=2925408 RepID=UPI001F59DAC6|nr:glycosyltransferase family 4 protein [Anaeromyxobacter sp. SG63]